MIIVYILKRNTGCIFLVVYVDDVLIIGNNDTVIQEIKQHMHHQFTIKDLGQVKYFLGIEVARNPRGTFLSQRKYIMTSLKM